MIKLLVPRMQGVACDRGIQKFCVMCLSAHTEPPGLWTGGRLLRIADGPDELPPCAACEETVDAAEHRGAGRRCTQIPTCMDGDRAQPAAP
ncbi:MAG: hypothetical protein A3K04_11740 [Gallionellales bacterium RBG_16_56_9]|nr:MAG: hypothetical protein A3K04_11740 [Gallionellales bacterium RBG_16_56_9]